MAGEVGGADAQVAAAVSTELVRREPAPLETSPSVVNQDDWAMLRKIAETVVGTDFVPKAIRGNGPAVMACLLYGREQGLGPMTALKEVAMVDGKPTMSAALMAAKIRAAGHSLQRSEHRNPDGTVVATTAHGRRGDNGDTDDFTFSLEMAGRAGLAGKGNWRTYPEAMLWARAVSQLARTLFSDVFIGGAYTAEEMGAADTDEGGKIIDAEMAVESSGPEPRAGNAAAKGADVSSPPPAPSQDAGVSPPGTPGPSGPETPDEPEEPEEPGKPTRKQHGLLHSLIAELDAKQIPVPDEAKSWNAWTRAEAKRRYGVTSRAELTRAQMGELIDTLDAVTLPF